MAVEVELEDVTIQSFRLAGDSCFDVKINGASFCSLVRTGNYYILGWDGRVPFPTLEDEVFERLPLSIPLMIVGDNAIKEAARVSVLTSNADPIEFDLRIADDEFALRRWLSDPAGVSSISFIRIDVGNPEDLLDYSFTTETKPVSERDELSLRLPRRVPISESLLRWIYEHHQNPPRLENGDTYLIADKLNEQL